MKTKNELKNEVENLKLMHILGYYCYGHTIYTPRIEDNRIILISNHGWHGWELKIKFNKTKSLNHFLNILLGLGLAPILPVSKNDDLEDRYYKNETIIQFWEDKDLLKGYENIITQISEYYKYKFKNYSNILYYVAYIIHLIKNGLIKKLNPDLDYYKNISAIEIGYKKWYGSYFYVTTNRYNKRVKFNKKKKELYYLKKKKQDKKKFLSTTKKYKLNNILDKELREETDIFYNGDYNKKLLNDFENDLFNCYFEDAIDDNFLDYTLKNFFEDYLDVDYLFNPLDTCEYELNEYGYLDYISPEKDIVCPQCYCCVLPNRGQGNLCGSCEREDYLESEHNYYDFY